MRVPKTRDLPLVDAPIAQAGKYHLRHFWCQAFPWRCTQTPTLRRETSVFVPTRQKGPTIPNSARDGHAQRPALTGSVQNRYYGREALRPRALLGTGSPFDVRIVIEERQVRFWTGDRAEPATRETCQTLRRRNRLELKAVRARHRAARNRRADRPARSPWSRRWSSAADAGNGSGSISAMRPAGSMPGLPPQRGKGEIDDEHERWLITKEDRMDYGPFSLRDVKAQIERGSIRRNTRSRIPRRTTNVASRITRCLGKWPEWTAKHMELDRQMKEEAERARSTTAPSSKCWRASSRRSWWRICVGVWLVTRPKPQVVKQTGPQFTDDPLKGLQIAMQPMPPPPKRKEGGTEERGV